ncbi:MAG: hypothetical protein AVDCRST_MAG32-2916, partial [uncultured Nocardioides sp.]
WSGRAWSSRRALRDGRPARGATSPTLASPGARPCRARSSSRARSSPRPPSWPRPGSCVAHVCARRH